MQVEEITPGVVRLRTLIANVYMAGSPGGPWVLVDTGTPGNAACIRNAAARHFGREVRPEAILLTHGH
jgi:glyoxylase-like metal-dependent hydrolase (beta-lactamase superfamily II)